MEAVNEESSSVRLRHEIRTNQKQKKIPHLSPECVEIESLQMGADYF